MQYFLKHKVIGKEEWMRWDEKLCQIDVKDGIKQTPKR